MAIGIILLKGDLAWPLKDMVRCLATAGLFLAAPVDMAAVTRCKAATAALQALVDILPMVKLATTVAIRADVQNIPKRRYNSVAICNVLLFFKIPMQPQVFSRL